MVGWLVGWLVCWLELVRCMMWSGWLVCMLIGEALVEGFCCMHHRLIDVCVDCFIDWVHWLMHCLVEWLVSAVG